MTNDNHAVYIDGDLYLRADPRRTPPDVAEDKRVEFTADMALAIAAGSEANTDTPIPEGVAPYLADSVWWRFVSLRPVQMEALIDLQVKADRFDASLVSMITGVKVSEVKALARKVQKAVKTAPKETAVEKPGPSAPPSDETADSESGQGSLLLPEVPT